MVKIVSMYLFLLFNFRTFNRKIDGWWTVILGWNQEENIYIDLQFASENASENVSYKL